MTLKLDYVGIKKAVRGNMRFLLLNIMAFCLMLITTSAHARITPATEYEPKTEDVSSPSTSGVPDCAELGYYSSKPAASTNLVCAQKKVFSTATSDKTCWVCICPEKFSHESSCGGPSCTVKRRGVSVTRYACQ